MQEHETSAPSPHRDPAQWGQLIDSLEISVILVVISSWMGRRLRQEFTPEDIWQETLAMAWRDRESHDWRGLRAFRAWLLGIAKNRVRDAAEHVGAKKRGGDDRIERFSTLVEGKDASVGDYLPPESTTPSRVAFDREQAQVLEDVLVDLPTELGDVVRLRLFEELPMRLVAERLGIGLTTANERFLRGASLYQTRLESRLGPGSSVRPTPDDGLRARIRRR